MTNTLTNDDAHVLLARKRSPLGKLPVGYYLSLSRLIFDPNHHRVRGLFTSRFIAKGSLVGEYRGKIVDHNRTRTKLRFTQYFFAVAEETPSPRLKFVIDGANFRMSSFLRFVNAPNNASQANTRFVQVGDSILMYATRDIRPNNELLASYGKDTKRIIRQH